MLWLKNNIGNLIICLLLSVIVILIIRSIIKSHKKGVSVGCGGDCSHCLAACSHKVHLPKKL